MAGWRPAAVEGADLLLKALVFDDFRLIERILDLGIDPNGREGQMSSPPIYAGTDRRWRHRGRPGRSGRADGAVASELRGECGGRRSRTFAPPYGHTVALWFGDL